MLRTAAPGRAQSVPRARTDGVTIDEDSVQKVQEAVAVVAHVAAELAVHAHHLQIESSILEDLQLQQHQQVQQGVATSAASSRSTTPAQATPEIAVPRSSTRVVSNENHRIGS